jgi:hypothetical protein
MWWLTTAAPAAAAAAAAAEAAAAADQHLWSRPHKTTPSHTAPDKTLHHLNQ